MSAVTDIMPLTEEELNPTDGAILDELREGRCTPAYIAEKHSYTSGNVRNRMTHLASHGHVEGIGGGLYRLADDPRDNVETVPDADDLRERIDSLEEDLSVQRETTERYKDELQSCREQLEGTPDHQELKRAIDNLEHSLGNSGMDVDVAIRRLKEAAGVNDE